LVNPNANERSDMKKGRRPIELEDHDRTLGKGLEIGMDRYDDDEIIDLEEIIEVDGGILEDDEDFDLDVELIDLDSDLDFDDLEPEMMPVTGKKRDEAFLPDHTRGLGASMPVEEPKAPVGQLPLPGLDFPASLGVKPKPPAPRLKAGEPMPGPAQREFAPEVKPEKPVPDPFDALLTAELMAKASAPELKPKEPIPEVKAKEMEPESKVKPAGPDYFDVLLAAEMRKALADEEEPSALELLEKGPAPGDAFFTPAVPTPEVPVAAVPTPEVPVAAAAIPEIPAAAAAVPEAPAPAIPVPEAIPDRQLEDLVVQIESKLIEAIREIVEARLPGIVETVLREEIERLKKELV
jgi:hypothetical protein